MKCLCDKCKHADGCPAKAEHGGALRCSAFKRNEQTNEEWLHTLNTEQMAGWIAKIISDTIKFTHGSTAYTELIKSTEWWVEWLNQPHKDGEP